MIIISMIITSMGKKIVHCIQRQLDESLLHVGAIFSIEHIQMFNYILKDGWCVQYQQLIIM